MMPEKQRKGSYLFLLPSAVIMVLQFAMSFFFMELGAVFFAASYSKTADYNTFMRELAAALTETELLTWASVAYAVVAIILFWFWYKRIKPLCDEVKTDDSLKHYPALLYAGLVLFAAAAQYVSMYLINVLSYMFPDWLEYYYELMDAAGLTGEDGYAVSTVIYAAFVGPIAEELCFRGVTYQYARKYFPFWTANIAQALLFGAMHMNPLQSAYAFAIGLFFGLIYEKTRNIFVTIILHILYNGSGMLLENILDTGDTPVEFYVTLFISLCAGYIGYMMIAKAEDMRAIRLKASADGSTGGGTPGGKE